MRLQKKIAESGYCSRRKAEELIKSGKIKVNGLKAQLGQNVEQNDEIYINGKLLETNRQKIYIILNKPMGYTCTNRFFKGEKNIFDLINIPERLFVVGRLDKNSRGLVLLTNDGDYAQKMAHPRYAHEKVYIVQVASNNHKNEVRENWDNKVIGNLLRGVKDEGEQLNAKQAMYLGNNKFKVVLTQGRKRQIRRMFKVLGLHVVDLMRIQIDNITLDDLKEGKYKEIKIDLVKGRYERRNPV